MVACDKYGLRNSFKGEITYFLCKDQPVPAQSDRRRLWARFCTGGQQVMPLPGRHGMFHREPQRSAVVAGLRTVLGVSA